MKSKTAILIFTRPGDIESSLKRLHPNSVINQNIFMTLNQQVIKTVSGTGFDYFISDRQVGHTFGHRLRHAMTEVFKKGYESVVVVGNDNPELSSDIILQAAKHLVAHQPVLGPNTDGGVYLIGCTRDQFQSTDWLHIRWNSRYVLKDLNRQFENACLTTIQLDILGDLDSSWDFIEYLRNGSFSDIWQQFQHLISSWPAFIFTEIVFLKSILSPHTSSLRAPPISLKYT